jgi:ABC-2 type transport system permease protein
MSAIFKREFSAYFISPIGYVYLAVFYCISGFMFFANTLAMNSTDLTGVFSSLFVLSIVLVSMLTMRLMSEDKKHRTDQALLTAPISLLALQWANTWLRWPVYLLGISMTLVYGVVVALFATPDWAVIMGNFVGLFLLGAAMIAIGLFISALTESQIVCCGGHCCHLADADDDGYVWLADAGSMAAGSGLWPLLLAALSKLYRRSTQLLQHHLLFKCRRCVYLPHSARH